MSDVYDRASEREEEFRSDSIEAWARRHAATLGNPSALYCVECEEPIPDERRRAVPGVETCVDCQRDMEARGKR